MSTTQPSPAPYTLNVATGETAVLRGVGRCILLLIVSFGLWGFAWIYHTTKEVSSRVNQPAPVGRSANVPVRDPDREPRDVVLRLARHRGLLQARRH
jgi:hypothetical protein